jgi:hypothetical protein
MYLSVILLSWWLTGSQESFMVIYLFRRNNVNYYVKIIREDGSRVLIQSLAGAWLLEEWVEKEQLQGPIGEAVEQNC